MAINFLNHVDITGRLDVASDLRLRGNGGNLDQGVVRQYVDSSNVLNIDAGNNGSGVVQIQSDGDIIAPSSIGIGTTSPTGNFNSYISATRQITHNGNGGDFSVISDNNSSPVFYVKGTGTADLVNVLDNTTNVFTIKDGGNIGIGTTSPSEKLEVNGNVKLTGTSAGPILYLANTTSSTGKTWRASSAANGNFYITQDGVIDAITINHTTGNVNLGGKLTIATRDTNTSSTTALVMNGTEVEQRTLGSLAFLSSVTVTWDDLTGDQSNINISGFNNDANYTANGLATTGGTMTGNLKLNDSVQLRIGTGNDLKLVHDGTDSFINSDGSGDLYIQQFNDDKDIIFKNDDGSGGITEYFRLDGSAARSVFSKNALWVDNTKARFGSGGDLEIYHNGTHSFISDQGTGNLTVLTSKFVVNKQDDAENMIIATADGSVELFHNNSKKLETTSTGIGVTAGSNNQKVATFTGNNSGRGLEITTYQQSNHDAGVILDAVDPSHGTLKFQTSSSDAMVIDVNQKVGIGTTSPQSPLTVKSSSVSAANSGVTLIANGSTDIIAAIGEKSTNGGRFHLYDGGVEKVAFYSDGTNNHISAGNVGIGTTSPQKKLDVYLGTNNAVASIGGGISAGEYAGLHFGYSETGNSNYRHSAIVFERDDTGHGDARGNIHILNSASGSASADLGDARLTILPSGNVGIGTTSPAQKLHVSGGHILLDNNTEIRQKDSGGSERTIIELDSSDDLNIGGSYSGALKFIGGGSYAEKMRIHDNGYVGINTTSPTEELTVNGDGNVTGSFAVGITTAHASFNFYNQGTAYFNGNVTVDANLSLGDSDVLYLGAGNDLQIYHDGNNSYVYDSGTGELRLNTGNAVRIRKHDNETMALFTANGAVELYYDNAKKFETTSAGITVTGAITASDDITAFSDERLKEDIKPLEESLEKVQAIQGVSFVKKNDEDKKQNIGFIAQQLKEVLPEVVHENEDGIHSVAYGNITALLVEAVKEQQDIIAQLEERITDLENRL